MRKELELLAPARNADIGIAAIDCGADAVYIAAENFGARQAAGNSTDEIARLCRHAHKFGARVFVTVNTIIYNNELSNVRATLGKIAEAGADAIIVQDPAVAEIASEICPDVAIHASTQCSIRTPERAKWLESLGFSRLILERQMSLEQIRSISEAVHSEIEFFVHGALCVCYSGQCYLSEFLSSRSANRGCCIQACRSRYDLEDERGRTLVKDKALLSLKDYKLIDKLEDLAAAGVSSFKIEGRLKNESYVRNVVREYSLALDTLVQAHPDLYRRASFGQVRSCFTPSLDKTFNRGYTRLFIDGKKDRWAAMDAAKGMGEEIGHVTAVKTAGGRGSMDITLSLKPGVRLSNGDGFSLVGKRADIVGFRGDVCSGNRISCKAIDGISPGAIVYRNLDSEFEKEIGRHPGVREIGVDVRMVFASEHIDIHAISEDGREYQTSFTNDFPQANDRERIENLVTGQMGKSSGIYRFTLKHISGAKVPLLSAAFINGIRRQIAQELDKIPVRSNPMLHVKASTKTPSQLKDRVSYKENVANDITRRIYASAGASGIPDAFELTHQEDAELMRSRYCVRFELGLCPKHHHSGSNAPLTLVNNGRRLCLEFDCRACEMILRNPRARK